MLLALLALCIPVASGCGVNRASHQVAFMGDSLTEGWTLPRVNYGITGQTTALMRARFAAQVLGHGYRRVIILGGTNDILLGVDTATTLRNLAEMADLARNDGVEPVLAEIPPIYRNGGAFAPSVQSLNRGIVALAHEKGLKLVDYYDAVNGHPDYESDGVHMKRSGYLAMEWALLRTTNPF